VIALIIWLALTFAVHSLLWGNYDVPQEDFLPFFLIDAAISSVVFGFFAWLWSKIK
jgi:hypothetical protein